MSGERHDPRRDYIGKEGAYYKTHVGSGARIVCLRCMASFRTRMATVFLDGLQDTWVQTRFCPCCGSELTQLITPDTPARDGKTALEVNA